LCIRVLDLLARGAPFVQRGSVDVEAGHREARPHEMRRHGEAHGAQADEAHLWIGAGGGHDCHCIPVSTLLLLRDYFRGDGTLVTADMVGVSNNARPEAATWAVATTTRLYTDGAKGTNS